jgi:chromosome segregation ATPase
MMIAPPPVTELNTVSALLAVIADPKKSAEALAGIKAATAEYVAAGAKATEDRAAAEKALAEARDLAAANEASAARLASETAAAVAKARAVAAKEKELSEEVRGLANLRETLEAELSAREDAVARREAAAAEREAQAADARRVADAMVAEYGEKLAKLRALAG